MRSIGSRARMSHLFMKVNTGMRRSRQASKSLRVCASTPFAPSITMITESAAVSVR